MTDKELFDFAKDNGIINPSELEALYKKMEYTKYLEKHFGEGYVLTKGRDGRYFTRLPNGKQIRLADKEKFIEKIIDYYKKENKIFSVKQVFDMWLEFKYKYEGICRGTYDRLKTDFNRFFVNNEFAAGILKKECMLDITEEELEMFIRDTIRTYNLTAKGWQKLKSLIVGIWLYGSKIKATDVYITKFIDSLAIRSKVLKQRVENEDEQVFTDEEVRMILDDINKSEFLVHNYGIVLCFYTGMRSGEISGLKWEDISDDFSTIIVRHTEVFYKDEEHEGRVIHEVVDHAKTVAGLRKIIVPDVLIPYLKILKEKTGNCEYVFTYKGRRVHGANFSDRLVRICNRLNITPRRMHKIRKTVCSKLCDGWVDDRLILRQIGHTNKNTTETFYHRDRRTLDEKKDMLNRAISY